MISKLMSFEIMHILKIKCEPKPVGRSKPSSVWARELLTLVSGCGAERQSRQDPVEARSSRGLVANEAGYCLVSESQDAAVAFLLKSWCVAS